jgi:Domain of unknown function (DUF4389)
MEATPQTGAVPGYPIRLDVDYPERLSRWKIFVKWLLAIPHYIVLYLLGIVLNVFVLIAFFSILFTKRWPRGMFDFAVQIERWIMNVYFYVFLMRDEYPPFSGEAGNYPLTFEVDYDDQLSRWQIFLKWLFAIPHLIILTVLSVAAFVVHLIAFFAILFTAQYPRGLFDFSVGVVRWYQRVYGYAFLLFTDRYPPFSLR